MMCSRLHTELCRIARGVSSGYDVTCLRSPESLRMRLAAQGLYSLVEGSRFKV